MSSIELVADRNSFRKLLAFVFASKTGLESDSGRIDIDVVGKISKTASHFEFSHIVTKIANNSLSS